MIQAVNAAQVKAIAESIGKEVGRVGSISTDLRKGGDREDQRMVILHACESGKLHNRSYIIDARVHAESVLVNREGISAAAAMRVWGLMRDLWELAPHSRLCVRQDAPEGYLLQPNGVMLPAGGSTVANDYLASCVQQLHALLPLARAVDCKLIRNDRLRVYVEVIGIDDSLLLCTDAQAINDMIRRIALGLSDPESLHLKHRLKAWSLSLGVSQDQMLPVLDQLASLVRFGPFDRCELANESS